MVEKLAGLSSENSSESISTMFREYKTVLVRFASYANTAQYICIYISPGDEFSTQHRLSIRSMVNTMLSRIIARERFSKGGGVEISQHPP